MTMYLTAVAVIRAVANSKQAELDAAQHAARDAWQDAFCVSILEGLQAGTAAHAVASLLLHTVEFDGLRPVVPQSTVDVFRAAHLAGVSGCSFILETDIPTAWTSVVASLWRDAAAAKRVASEFRGKQTWQAL